MSNSVPDGWRDWSLTIVVAAGETACVSCHGANRLGGSSLAQVHGQLGATPPDLDDAGLLTEYSAGGAAETFIKAQKEGKVRFLGLSAHDPKAAIRLINALPKWWPMADAIGENSMTSMPRSSSSRMQV